MSLFAFVQLEFPWALGPADGRYLIRGHAGQPSHVLVIGTLGAQERRRRLSRRRARPRSAEPLPDPAPVVTARVTLVHAEPLPDPAAAQEWVARTDLATEADRAILALNRVLHAHRTAAMDPHTREVTRTQALVIRAGVGEGEAVAHGRWSDAVELPQPVRLAAGRRASLLRPQERLAAVLGGRDVALAAEELTLRARADLDAGRGREAALQLRIALEAALAELVPWAGDNELRQRLQELHEQREGVGEAADIALLGGLDERTSAAVGHALSRLEAALRARTTPALG